MGCSTWGGRGGAGERDGGGAAEKPRDGEGTQVILLALISAQGVALGGFGAQHTLGGSATADGHCVSPGERAGVPSCRGGWRWREGATGGVRCQGPCRPRPGLQVGQEVPASGCHGNSTAIERRRWGRWKALGVRGRGQAGARGWLGAAASDSWSQGDEFRPAVGVGRTSGTRAPAGGPCPALRISAAFQPVRCTPQLLLGRSRDSSGLFLEPLALPALRSSLPVLLGPPGRGHSWRSAAVTCFSVPVRMTSGGRGEGWLSSQAGGPAPPGRPSGPGPGGSLVLPASGPQDLLACMSRSLLGTAVTPAAPRVTPAQPESKGHVLGCGL